MTNPTMKSPTIIIAGLASTSTAPYPSAIAFAFFGLLTSALIIPISIWHARHHNVGATSVTFLAILANILNFLNAAIWPHDDVSRWFSGVGYCDIQIKLQAVMQTAFPAALFCILRKLATVLDTRKAKWTTSAARERREFVVDLVICGGLPWLQALFAFVVQPARFFVSGIAGCQTVNDGTWVSALLLLAPRLLWTTACVYLSVLIIIRLIVYRREVVSMLTHHNTNKSRFLRLYLLCTICIMGIFPLEIYIDYRAISAGLLSFDWAQTHDPTPYDWNSIFFIPSGGVILFDRYIWLAGGLLIFLTFGFGREAIKMYRDMLVKIGLARFFPCLLQTGQTTTSTTGGSGGSWMSSTTSSMSCKVRLILGKTRDITSSRSAHSTDSTSSSQGSPREKLTFDTRAENVC